MLRSLLICPNPELAGSLTAAIKTVEGISISQTIAEYPNTTDLIRAIRASAPEVLFLSFESADKARAIVGFLESSATGIHILAIHGRPDPNVMRAAMRCGARDFLAHPFERAVLMDAMANLSVLSTASPKSEAPIQILSFLPSKAGVGASTVALNVSAVLARQPGARVLLSDFDLCGGMTRFLLKLSNEYSVADAVEHAHEIEEGLWQSMVTKVDALDVLHSGRVSPNLHIQDAQVRALMEFLQSRYRVLCFDLSANLEQYALALMKESTRIVLVCTPELPSLHLAGEKLAYLRTLELDRRVSVVLNRSAKLTALNKDQVEQFLGRPVLQQLPNDYRGVADAMAMGTCVGAKSALGKSLVELAAKLADDHAPALPEAEAERSRFWALAGRPVVAK